MSDDRMRTIGRYELHAQLASGGMASVYLGRLIGAAGFAKCVAIKRLHPHLAEDPDFVTAILEEARLAERVKHPNVVATIDVVAEADGLLLVMEYVHGQTLARLLRSSNEAKLPCPPAIAARMLHDVLLGLHAAHNAVNAKGAPLCIIHRDVSPQNVIVGADGVTRLVDFGVAKAFGSIGHTREGHLKGKVPYMAPEILRFEQPSPQTDIWAAAVVLWETRCARRLFRGESELQLWGAVVEGEIPDPATIVTTPSLLDSVILRGLQRDVKLRYQTALAMANDIEACIRMASPAEVAAWVTERAGPALAEQEKLLRSVENAPASADVVAPSVSLAPPRKRKPGYAALGLLTGGFITAAALFAFAPDMRRPQATLPIAPTRAPEVDAATTPPPPAPTPSGISATGDDAASVADASAPAASTTRLAGPLRRHPPGTHAIPPAVPNEPRPSSEPAASAPRPDCDPPYFVDSTGHKRFRLECVTGR